MSRTIKEALRLTKKPKAKFAFGGASYDDGAPDEESQEKFLKEQLEGSAPQYEPEAGLKTAKEAALMGAGFAPGSGLATASGRFPTAEGGFEPSVKEDIKAGKYGSAALKTLGAAGDVASVVPGLGTVLGTAMKAPLALKIATAMAPAAKIAREAAPVAKAVEETAEAAPAYQRLVNPAGFYSRAHEAAMLELPEGERTWQEMRSLLAKKPGVKETELTWSGLHPEAFEPGQKITREEIAKRVEQNFPMVERVVKGGADKKLFDELNQDYAAKQDVFMRTREDYDTLANRTQGGVFGHELVPLLERNPEKVDQILKSYPENTRAAAEKFLESYKDLNAAEKAKESFEYTRPMHEHYTVPGGENYSERVLTHQYNVGKAHPEVEAKYADELARLRSERDEIVKNQKSIFENHPEVDPDPLIKELNTKTSEINDLQRKISEESAALRPEYTTSKFRHEGHLGDINNPILHTRNSERVGPNGERILHQEEVQSDWAQQGREKGFKDSEPTREELARWHELSTKPDRTSAEEQELTALNRKQEQRSQIPRAPHVEDTEHWLDLAAKDTLSHAIENGFDKVFITGGQEQAKRWSNELRKAVDEVRWEKGADTWKGFGTPEEQAAALARYNAADKKLYNLRGSDPRYAEANREYVAAKEAMRDIAPGWGRQEGDVPKVGDESSRVVYAKPTGSNQEHRFVVKQVEGPNGKPRTEVVDSSIPSAKGETLAAVVGGDLAKRIMAEESGTQAMKGYRMGSEGYTQTYERKYPSSFKKLMKQLDPEAKVEAGPLASKTAEFRQVHDFVQNYMDTELERIAREEYGSSVQNLSPTTREDIMADLSIDARDAALGRFGDFAREALERSPSELPEAVHGTYINITPKMREKYFELKKKHGSVFPAYKRGGTVDKVEIPRYTKAARQLLDKALNISRKLTE